jgi:hypothetical protein
MNRWCSSNCNNSSRGSSNVNPLEARYELIHTFRDDRAVPTCRTKLRRLLRNKSQIQLRMFKHIMSNHQVRLCGKEEDNSSRNKDTTTSFSSKRNNMPLSKLLQSRNHNNLSTSQQTQMLALRDLNHHTSTSRRNQPLPRKFDFYI